MWPALSWPVIGWCVSGLPLLILGIGIVSLIGAQMKLGTDAARRILSSNLPRL